MNVLRRTVREDDPICLIFGHRTSIMSVGMSGTPSYLKPNRASSLTQRIEDAFALLRECRLCPRACGVKRLEEKKGYCKTGRRAKVASASPHFGEESPLVGRGGSGTIFFSSCNLLCSFCQNYDISHYNEGLEFTAEKLALTMLALQKRGCHNINFVTPSHVVPQILEALPMAIDRGLNVPLVYNCGGYESVETLKLLEGVFDIYMPDFKFWENRWADIFCHAPDYRDVAKAAFREMHRQVGDLQLDEQGIAVHGLLVRHLLMPNWVAGTKDVVEFLAQEISRNTYVNIMDQFRPCYLATSDPKINRRITRSEFRQALEWAQKAGLSRFDEKKAALWFL